MVKRRSKVNLLEIAQATEDSKLLKINRRKSIVEARNSNVHSKNYKRLAQRDSQIGRDLLNFSKPIIDQPLHLLNLLEFDYDNPPYLYESPLIGDNSEKNILGGSKFMPIDSFMPDESFVIASKDH